MANRRLYREMLRWELLHASEDVDVLAETIEKDIFGDLISRGKPLDRAREQAAAAAREYVRDHEPERTRGRRERERRRTFREAVTACHGVIAVATGLVEACIVCGGPLQHRRSDSAYCSNACRQAAYRKRRNGHSQQKSITVVQAARERKEMQRAALKAGLSQSEINECIRFAKIPEEDFEELLEYQPINETIKMLRAMQAAQRRQAAGGPR